MLRGLVKLAICAAEGWTQGAPAQARCAAWKVGRATPRMCRVCLLAVHDTCTMPISRARPVVRECRCSVEAAHVRSDETLLGTRTRDGVVRFGLLQGPSRQCRAFASTMFQCGDAKHQSVPAALSLILMRTKCKIFVSMCPGSTERTVNWSVCTPH